MAEHTKGPWVVNPFCAQVDSSAPSKLGGLLPIARLLWPTDQRSEAETEANAHLIAAAPDLLEALETAPIIRAGEAVEQFRGRQDQWLREVYSPAIAKARRIQGGC